jgi:restriction endonuclease S subunit
MLNLANCAHIPERLKDKFVAAKKNDIIVTATGEGTAGRADIFLESETYIVTGENILLRPKMDRVNPFYLLAMLRTDHVARQLTRFVRGATGQTHLYWQDIASIQIPNADTVTQKACEVLFMKGAELRQKSDEQLGLFKTKGESVLVESSSVESQLAAL